MKFKTLRSELSAIVLPSHWLLMGFIILLGVLIPLFIFGGVPFIVDDFEPYELGDLTGQGGWEAFGGSSLLVNDDKAQSGSKSIWTLTGGRMNIKEMSPTINGTQSIWFLVDQGVVASTDFKFWGQVPPKKFEIEMVFSNYDEVIIRHYGGPELCVLPRYEWVNLQIEWDCATDKVRANCNFAGWTDWVEVTPMISIIKFSITNTKEDIYFDNLTGEYIPELEIKGISPESGTEITDFGSNLTIWYYYFNWEIYDGFVVNFKDNKIEGLANSVLFEKDDLDPSGSGQKTISLADFGIDSNGRWDLTGLGFGTKLDIEGGMFLTTRGYIDFWTDELVTDPYYLIINVEGLPDFYTFTDAPTWYGANVDRFDTPTTFFTTFVNLMTPTFEKLGEFGRRSLTLFDSNESYDRGYALGEIFPLINAYIQKIDLFFGGFPLASFFKYLILLMFAGFIIRTILKFIPMLG